MCGIRYAHKPHEEDARDACAICDDVVDFVTARTEKLNAMLENNGIKNIQLTLNKCLSEQSPS